MPILDLPKDPPIAGANTIAYPVVSHMLFPQEEDAKTRRQWYACAMAGAYVHWRRNEAPWTVLAEFHGWISELWELPQSPKRVFQDGWARVKRAGLAGEMLQILVRLARHHPIHCKVERARALLLYRRSHLAKPPSESLIEKAWPDFKSASPLWAAYMDRDHNMTDRPGQWWRVLSVAEHYRREAESARLLRPSEAWRTPDDVELPLSILEIAPLTADELEFLDQQFPY
jgi:hypothetical protein